MDGDGLQEYQTRSAQGYENMAWKDGGDSVMYPDGTPVKGPKALCELQGYTYDPWPRMANAFDYFGQLEAATRLRRKAADLRQRFEQLFWVREDRILCVRARPAIRSKLPEPDPGISVTAR
jgi:glycogen debranching enzyme